MAPKDKKQQPAVEQLKTRMAADGFAFTAENIAAFQKKNGAKSTKAVVDAMSYALRAVPGGSDIFKASKSMDRFKHLERFCLDSSSAGLVHKAENFSRVQLIERDGKRFQDLTEKLRLYTRHN